MNILVTGASGLIGNYLLNYLYKKFPEANFYGTTYKNIPKSKFKVVYIPYSEIFKINLKFDQIWHFATYGQPVKFMKNWRDVINLNTHDLFDLCNLLCPKGKFLFASSSEIYDSNGNGLESEPPASFTCRPRSIYICLLYTSPSPRDS